MALGLNNLHKIIANLIKKRKGFGKSKMNLHNEKEHGTQYGTNVTNVFMANLIGSSLTFQEKTKKFLKFIIIKTIR